MKNLKEFYHNEKDNDSENDLLDKPHVRAVNSPVDVRVPIFHWNFSGRTMKDMKPSCTSRGCVVKAYRKMRNSFKIWKRTSNTLGKLDDIIKDKIKQSNPELRLTVPIQYNLVKILVSLIQLS